MIFGNLGNMGEMLKMAKEMKGKLSEMKKELEQARYQESAGGVEVIVSGEMEIKELKVEPKLAANISQLERAVKDAVNRVMKTAKDDAAKKMKGLTGGLGLPPGMV